MIDQNGWMFETVQKRIIHQALQIVYRKSRFQHGKQILRTKQNNNNEKKKCLPIEPNMTSHFTNQHTHICTV